MKVSPIDIAQHSFTRRWRGCDAQEVAAFLDLVRSDYEGALGEVENLRERAKRQEAELERLRDTEAELKRALVAAERLSAQITAAAEKEAKAILADAEVQAEKLLAQARDRMVRLCGDIDELKRVRARLEATLRGELQSHLALLDVRGEAVAEQEKVESVVPLLRRRAATAGGEGAEP